MARRDLMAVYGRLGLVVAVFAFVAGIIAGPLVQKVWPSRVTVTEHSEKPALRLPKPQTVLAAEQKG
jgi:hypothetical protein